MPSRYLRESITTSDNFNRLSFEAQAFVIRLLVTVDDYGRYHGESCLLRGVLFPMMLDRVSDAEVLRMRDEAASEEMIRVYESGGRPYVLFPNWEKFQTPANLGRGNALRRLRQGVAHAGLRGAVPRKRRAHALQRVLRRQCVCARRAGARAGDRAEVTRAHPEQDNSEERR